MPKFSIFILLTCLSSHIRSSGSDTLNTHVVNDILKFQSVASFFQCQTEAFIFNTAQKLQIPLPKIPRRPITEKDVSFHVYTRQLTRSIEVNTHNPNRSIRSAPINHEKRTVLYVTGIQTKYKQDVPAFVNGLLPKQDINLIFLDFDSYSFYNPNYSRNNTVPRLGNILAKFLHQLIDSGTDPKNIYLIGMSSGSQTIGIAGQQIRPKIGRILGIDPVGTCYNFLPASMRLSLGDADFVEIIHCSSGNEGELSVYKGDVTFYVNGGKIQPSCRTKKKINDITQCSHEKCIDYVKNSLLKHISYVGVKCETRAQYLKHQCNCGDTAVLGYYTSLNARGTYYVNTKTNPSLC